MVSTHSRPKAAGNVKSNYSRDEKFQHTAARRRLALSTNWSGRFRYVSTHSRPKAAGHKFLPCKVGQKSFNTQPPEGGWLVGQILFGCKAQFQHTAARRRLACSHNITHGRYRFQHTAARRRLVQHNGSALKKSKFQHTAARRRLDSYLITRELSSDVSTHSRPKAAGLPRQRTGQLYHCFNTQPPEGGWAFPDFIARLEAKFQHTAARRRLGLFARRANHHDRVSTHSRPKAAGFGCVQPFVMVGAVSTHSRPKAAG